MSEDLWHYPRTHLAQQIIGMFDSGLSSALVFFAPRRMGKTEFLCKDILPLAEKNDWKVFYFSFLDVGTTANIEFTKALATFAENIQTFPKTRRVFQKISKISGEAVGIKADIELRDHIEIQSNMKEIAARLAKQGKILLLMDEVQALAQESANSHFIAALRTVLDLHKDSIKVIFTGSSQEGLRRMFSEAKAPFFHFGQNLPFPELDQGFTDHLADMFEMVTKRKIDQDALWVTFQQVQKVPHFARSLVERIALNPNLSIEDAKVKLLNEIFDARAFSYIWKQCSILEKLILREITKEISAVFSAETRNRLAKILGLATLLVPSVQSALRVLQRKGLIGRDLSRGIYFIDDPNFKNWILQLTDDVL